MDIGPAASAPPPLPVGPIIPPGNPLALTGACGDTSSGRLAVDNTSDPVVSCCWCNGV
jgi:hypothetical protein